MATPSHTYVPTNRKPNEYIVSHGLADGHLSNTGWSWYESTPRMADAIRATILFGGLPMFAPAGKTSISGMHDYAKSFVWEKIAFDKRDALLQAIQTSASALQEGNWPAAEATLFAALSLEEKMEQGLVPPDTVVLNVRDLYDVPNYGNTVIPFDMDMWVSACRNDSYELDVHTTYFFHVDLNQWWTIVYLPDQRTMWLPLVLAFRVAAEDTLKQAQALHAMYPESYARDIADLDYFNALRS